jgi:nucleoid DNA-binding protein
MRYAKRALAGLAVILALGLIVTAEAQVAGGKKTTPANLKAGIVAATKEKQATIEKIFKALGPAVSEQLRAGREVELPGVGMLRVVRVAEYKDLVGGRPAVIPARNYVEFVPTASLNSDANSPGARPARTVPGFDFRVNPNADEGIRTGSTRNPGTRTR